MFRLRSYTESGTYLYAKTGQSYFSLLKMNILAEHFLVKKSISIEFHKAQTYICYCSFHKKNRKNEKTFFYPNDIFLPECIF